MILPITLKKRCPVHKLKGVFEKHGSFILLFLAMELPSGHWCSAVLLRYRGATGSRRREAVGTGGLVVSYTLIYM
jgi:hypothetical protein